MQNIVFVLFHNSLHLTKHISYFSQKSEESESRKNPKPEDKLYLPTLSRREVLKWLPVAADYSLAVYDDELPEAAVCTDECLFINHPETATHVVACPRDDTIVVAFRGTIPCAQNVYTDVDYILESFESEGTLEPENIQGLDQKILRHASANLRHKGSIHKGFKHIMNNIKEELFAVIVSLTKSHRGIRKILFTGHSLGGSLALLASVEWRMAQLKNHSVPGLEIVCTAFGTPLVGDLQFMKFFAALQLSKRTIMFTHDMDPIPGSFLWTNQTYAPWDVAHNIIKNVQAGIHIQKV